MAARGLAIDGSSLTLQDVVDVARNNRPVDLADSAITAMKASRQIVDDLVARGEVAYGITTGFGEFAHVTIEPSQTKQLQRNLILSHAVGVGDLLPRDVVRAMMLIRANALAKGLSGIRVSTVERLLEFLALDITPVVPSQGSVGSSGDLAPLSHIALALIGEGEVEVAGKTMTSAEAHAKFGIEPIELVAKEGLALINGTQMMAAIGCLSLYDAKLVFDNALTIGAMSLEALMGSLAPFDARVHEARAHPGQAAVAARIRELCDGSQIIASHIGCERVQDAYSLRCMPQVLGACKEALDRAADVLVTEINSASDNPLIFPNGDIISQGNFHGEPLALQLDFAAIALAEIANISERRTERMVNPDLSEGLKPFLVDAGGLNSGFMIAQYAAAALVSENKIHAHPASVDSIPTSANQEDHNSMGSIAAVKLAKVLANIENVLAVEALCAAQGLDMKAPLAPGKLVARAHAEIRKIVPRLTEDRYLAPDIKAIQQHISMHKLIS